MLRVYAVCLLVGLSLAQTTPNGVVCNYAPTGDETTENAVPINTFRTSGDDFIRPAWCITHCSDRKSIKAAMLFQPVANASTPIYNVRTHQYSSDRRIEHSATLVKGKETKPLNLASDNTFCVDTQVAAIVDAVFDKYNDIETISEALNYYVNKPMWAYLVYLMGPPPSIIVTINVHQDSNFCMKTIEKQNPDGTYSLYQMFGGRIQGNR